MQGCGKWRVACQNLAEGQLVLVGNAEDTNKRGTYRLGTVHCVHPQLRRSKEIVRRATIAVLKNSGSKEIEYILRDVSKIAMTMTMTISTMTMFYFVLFELVLVLCCKLIYLRFFSFIYERIMLAESFDTVYYIIYICYIFAVVDLFYVVV